MESMALALGTQQTSLAVHLAGILETSRVAANKHLARDLRKGIRGKNN